MAKKKLTKVKKIENTGESTFGRNFVIVALVIYIISLAYTVTNSNAEIYEVNYGEIEQSVNLNGIIIQSETVVSTNISSNTIFQKEEGTKVGANTVVAVVQDPVYAKAINAKIAEVDEKLKQATQNQGNSLQATLFNSDIEKLNDEIEHKTFELNKLIEQGNYTKVVECKEFIDKNLRKKIEISGQSGPSAEYISNLLQERHSYEEQLSNGQNSIIAKKAGLLSFKIDGYESQITSALIGNMDAEQLQGLIDDIEGKKYEVNNGIKIVDNFEYFASFIVKDLDVIEKIKDKTEVWIKKDANSTALIPAEIYNINMGENSAVLTLRMTTGFENNINQRLINVDIVWQKNKGLMIPVSSLVEQNGEQGVVAVVSNYFRFKKANIIVQNDKYAIVEETDFSMHEYNKEKNIVLYDHILKNGTLKRIGELYKY